MSQSDYSFSALLNFLNQNFLVVALSFVFLGVGFFGGSLWTENQILRGGNTVGTTNNAGSAPTAAAPAAPSGPTADQLGNLPEVGKDEYIRGAKNAKVTLVEYSDFECPFCQRFHPTMQQVMDEYGDQVAWVYRHYPLSFHANAQKAAEAAECVGKLAGNEAFWKFGDLYFERTSSNGTGFPLSDLASLGAEAGANEDAVQKCLDSDEMAEKVKDQFEKGSAAGVSGTPGTFIVTEDGVQELIPGALPYTQVQQAIEKYL